MKSLYLIFALLLFVPTANAQSYVDALNKNRPGLGDSYAKLVKTVLTGGTLPAERKAAMGLAVAKRLNVPYAIAQWTAILNTTATGRAYLAANTNNDADSLAIRYAELLTSDIHGVSDAAFDKLRSRYNDNEIVELTLTTCFMNYHTRLVAGLNLSEDKSPVSPLPPAAQLPTGTMVSIPRVGLVSDVEMEASAKTIAAADSSKANANGLGIAIPNSRRAMLRCPDIADAWNAYWGDVRKASKVDRSMLLQVSFAVSMANGCRYCTLHQVQGLYRLHVDPAKLVAMRRDDSALTPQELVTVTFARKLTAAPSTVNSADYAALAKSLSDDGAFDVLLQTCAFAFMNRFTDGLHLPSEDEAVQTYRTVYGADFAPKR